MVSLRRRKKEPGTPDGTSKIPSPNASAGDSTQTPFSHKTGPAPITETPSSFGDPTPNSPSTDLEATLPYISSPLTHQSPENFMERIATPSPKPLGTSKFYPKTLIESHTRGRKDVIKKLLFSLLS